MTSTTQPPEEGGPGQSGLSAHLLAFVASATGYLRARLELAGIEGQEAAAIYLKVAVLLVLGLLLFSFGYAFLWIGLIALLTTCVHCQWGWIVVLVALLHGLGATGCLWGIRALWKKQVFTATLEEFRKDQEWLNRHQ